eukprot:g41311.t1
MGHSLRSRRKIIPEYNGTLIKRANEWQTEFNLEKREVLHLEIHLYSHLKNYFPSFDTDLIRFLQRGDNLRLVHEEGQRRGIILKSSENAV